MRAAMGALAKPDLVETTSVALLDVMKNLNRVPCRFLHSCTHSSLGKRSSFVFTSKSSSPLRSRDPKGEEGETTRPVLGRGGAWLSL